MQGHHHEVEVEVGEDGLEPTLQDDWLTKEELAVHRTEEQQSLKSKFIKPKVKQEGERVQNQQSRPFSVSERREDTVNVSEGASNAAESSEGARNAPEPSEGVQEVPPLPVQVEGPTASIRLNPRAGRGQRDILNVKSTSVKSHFAALERVRELRPECKWTQR